MNSRTSIVPSIIPALAASTSSTISCGMSGLVTKSIPPSSNPYATFSPPWKLPSSAAFADCAIAVPTFLIVEPSVKLPPS